MGFFNPNTLIASLVWSAVGTGYVIYGRKRGEVIPALGGVGMVAASFVCSSALVMSGISIALLLAVYALNKLGYW